MDEATARRRERKWEPKGKIKRKKRKKETECIAERSVNMICV